MRTAYLKRKEALLRRVLIQHNNDGALTKEEMEVIFELRGYLARVQIMIQRNELKEVLVSVTRDKAYASIPTSTVKLLQERLVRLQHSEENINPCCVYEWIEHEGKCVRCRQCMLEDLALYIHQKKKVIKIY